MEEEKWAKASQGAARSRVHGMRSWYPFGERLMDWIRDEDEKYRKVLAEAEAVERSRGNGDEEGEGAEEQRRRRSKSRSRRSREKKSLRLSGTNVG